MHGDKNPSTPAVKASSRFTSGIHEPVPFPYSRPPSALLLLVNAGGRAVVLVGEEPCGALISIRTLVARPAAKCAAALPSRTAISSSPSLPGTTAMSPRATSPYVR